MDIFEHIVKEHREVDGMLLQLTSGVSGKQGIFDKLKLALTAHVQAEENSIYPAMSEAEHDFIAQATEEHRKITDTLDTIDRAGVDDASFSEKIATLAEMIQSHVQKEESQMIPKARDMFDKDQLTELSQMFDEVDERVMQKAR
jgi:hemerythrin superfamily protein